MAKAKRPCAQMRLWLAVAATVLLLGAGSLLLIAPVWQPGYHTAAYRPPADPSQTAAPAAGEKVDLNTADLQTLMTLPGVGAARAQAILDYRAAHGNFAALDEAAKVKGISEKMVASWADIAFVAG